MRLLIIRHGEPDYEHDTLTEKGRREAELLADRLERESIDHSYVSPLGRAQATARPTLERKGITAKTCDWLREFSYPVTDEEGRERGIPWDLMPAKWTAHPEYFTLDGWAETDYARSGDLGGHYRDVAGAFDALLAEHGYRRDGMLYRAERANQETIALFCHFGLECVLLSHLLNLPLFPLWHGTVALPTGVTTIYTEEREQGIAYFRMCDFGDVSHLTSRGEEPSFFARFCETYDNWEQKH